MVEQRQIHSTRERILAYLAQHPGASAQSLSRLWKLTPADIRYHLKVLLAEERIELVPHSFGNAARSGRPELFYRLPAASAPDNLAAFCGALLTTLLQTNDQAAIEPPLLAAAKNLVGTDSNALATDAPISPIRRLGAAVEKLNRWNYHASWEAGASGPRIRLNNCPYASIIRDHPEMCAFDRFLLENLTGTYLKQTARWNPTTGKPPACVFSTASQEVSSVSPSPERDRS